MTAKITTHVEDALSRLPEEFNGKENETFVVTTMAEQVQELENAWWQLFAERQIDTAVGQQLDDIGLIVLELRNGKSDADYKRFLNARIATNNSEGRISDVIRVTRSVLDDPTLAITFNAGWPAALVMNVTLGIMTSSDADILISFLRDTVAGGVRIILEYLNELEEASFTLGAVTLIDGNHSASDTALNVDSTEGFPDSGSLDLDYGGTGAETIAYTSKDTTTFFTAGLANAQVDNAHVELSASVAIGTGAANLLNGIHSIGATTLTYFDLDGDATSAFPATGSLTLSPGLAAEETVTYTSRTATQFSGVSALTNNHAANAEITGSGGAFISAVE